MMNSTNYEVPNYATVLNLSYFMSLTSKYYSKYPVSKHLQCSKFLSCERPRFHTYKNYEYGGVRSVGMETSCNETATCKMLTTY